MRGPRQDSLHDQMLDVIREAEKMGCYDAADWIKARWNMPLYWAIGEQMRAEQDARRDRM